MNQHYLRAIGAAFTLAVCTAHVAAAQTELPAQPDPSTPPARPLPPTPQRTIAPPAPTIPGFYPPNAIGLELGWGGPYGGLGLHYARMVTRNVDVNAGVGIGLGGKIGVGLRYFVRPDKQVSGYFGAGLARTGGIDNVEVTLEQEKNRYTQKPSALLHLRGGLRWQPGKVGLLATLGYGARLSGDPIMFDTFNYGTPSQDMRDMVRILSPGGLELSIGVLFGFGD